MLNPLEQLREDFKKYDPKQVIGSVMDAGNSYIVYLTPLNLKRGDAALDNEYKYDKSTRKITPFRVTDDPKLYQRANRHMVYLRPGLLDR